MAEKQTVLVYNADLQRETGHTIDVDGNGEIVLTCLENGRFIKFPAGTDVATLKTLVAQHKIENEGKITVAAIEAKKAEIAAGLNAAE